MSQRDPGRVTSRRRAAADEPSLRDGRHPREANVEPLTPELAFRVGRQLFATLGEHGTERVRVVIGRDTRTRASCSSRQMVPASSSAGGECLRGRVLRTTRIALSRASSRRGRIVSPSRTNSYEGQRDQVFSAQGQKFPDALGGGDRAARSPATNTAARARGKEIGRLHVLRSRRAVLIGLLSELLSARVAVATIVIDCAHGATYRVARRAWFRRLGARHCESRTGAKRTDQHQRGLLGALHPQGLQKKVGRPGGARVRVRR